MGFSADIDIAGAGAGSSLSVNGGKTDLNADYKGVGEQSGIFTGDGGLDLTAGCYAAAIAGSAGATSSFDHIKTGFNNYGKPLSQQSSGDLIKNLKGLGFTDKGARNIQLAADILGTGGLGYSVAANKGVNTTSKYATSSTKVAKKTVPEVRYNNPQVYREQLARQAGIPAYINTKNPYNAYGLNSEQLKTYFEIKGYHVNSVKEKAKGSGNAQVYAINNHPEIAKVQHSPSTSHLKRVDQIQHRGEYIKFTLKESEKDAAGIMKPAVKDAYGNNKIYVIDPKTFVGTAKDSTFYNQLGQRLQYVNGKYKVIK